MIIGNKELPDNCPDCNKKLIKHPSGRLINEGGPSYRVYYMGCLNEKCNYKSETVKIRDSFYNREKIEDVTPYKYGIIGKIFGLY